MDRLIAELPPSEQLVLASLARADEDIYRLRRRRRRLVSAMALSSFVCFAAARLGTGALRWSSLLFALLAAALLTAWWVERRVERRRHVLVERLPVEYRARIGATE